MSAISSLMTIRLTEGARFIGVRPSQFARMLSDAGLPTIQISDRREDVRVADFERLLALRERPARPAA